MMRPTSKLRKMKCIEDIEDGFSEILSKQGLS